MVLCLIPCWLVVEQIRKWNLYESLRGFQVHLDFDFALEHPQGFPAKSIWYHGAPAQ